MFARKKNKRLCSHFATLNGTDRQEGALINLFTGTVLAQKRERERDREQKREDAAA